MLRTNNPITQDQNSKFSPWVSSHHFLCQLPFLRGGIYSPRKQRPWPHTVYRLAVARPTETSVTIEQREDGKMAATEGKMKLAAVESVLSY